MDKSIIFFVGFAISFACCKKENATTISTVIQTDTVYVAVHDTITIPAMISDTITTCIVLRHAEKDSIGTDPGLSNDGIIRAEELRYILGNVAIHAIYSTAYNRTRQTVQPLATEKGLSITEYPTSKPYTQLVNEVLLVNRGKVVVIVGHSNTVPEIIKVLSNNSYAVDISESQYDNLFIVNRPDKLSPSVLRIKYGKRTP